MFGLGQRQKVAHAAEFRLVGVHFLVDDGVAKA